MKKKFLLLVCIVMVMTLLLAACSMVVDDSILRKDGYNIVVSFDCGKYENKTVSTEEDALPIQYGEVSIKERSQFNIGMLEVADYPVRSYYFNQENACVMEPGTIQQIPKPTLLDRVFDGWYIASVVAYQLDENGNPIKNKLGQYEYGGAVPQADDIKWDFANDTIGSYANHPYAVTKFVYDATKPFDAQVEVGGQTVTNGTQYTDEQLGYSEENGFNIYLYARWNVQPKFVVKADVEGDGTWEEVLKVNPNEVNGIKNGKMPDKSADLKRSGYTFYNLYSDPEFTQVWDSNATFKDTFTGGKDSLRPYKVLYAKYLEGEWNIVKKVSQLNSALVGNKNIYLDADLTYSEDMTWAYSANYTKEFNGNNHVITFENAMENPMDKNANAFGLFGTFSGKMYDVEFVNVTINMKNWPLQTTVSCGVLAGVVTEEASFSNVKISGKVIYSETIRTRANVPNSEGTVVLTIYRGDETNIDKDSWYGSSKQTSITGVTYVNTANSDTTE